MLTSQTRTSGHLILPANGMVVAKYAKRLVDDLKYSILILYQLEIALKNDSQVAIDELIITHRSYNYLVMEGFKWYIFLISQLNEHDTTLLNKVNQLKSVYAAATGRIALLFSIRSDALKKLIINHTNIKTSPGRSHSTHEATMIDIVR